MATEKNFENRIKRFLKEQGCWFIKYWGGGDYTKAGVPDILVSCQGIFVGLEVKAPKGRPTPLQIKNLKEIHWSGGYAVLLYPKDYDKFKHLILNVKCGNWKEVDLAYEYLMKEWLGWYRKYKREGLIA